MSAENDMDPGDIPAHLPELTQLEEMIIARSHVQMIVHRYRGHQYHYTGHCVSFMQSNIKTVDMLPNLPSELDIVLLRPSNRVLESESRYQRQFRTDFRVRRGHILAWLRYLKANHPDYQYITISPERINTLPVDDDISSSLASIIDNTLDIDTLPVSADLPPPNSQSMVLNLNVTTTEAELILGEISGRNRLPPELPAPSIRTTPIDEAAGKERIFAMAFPTLYPTGRADFNAPRLREVPLNKYAQHLIRFKDGRFGRHPRWRFFIFNLLMRRQAIVRARFYVSKASGLKDLTREELAEALLADKTLLPQIVRQGFALSGTRPFWRNKSNGLQAQARFLSPGMAPVFITFSAADMQWVDLHRHFPNYSPDILANSMLRKKFIWDGVQDNPHIVAHYLVIRLRAFKKHVLQPYLGFSDYWNRLEWQARGTGHEHGLYWVPSAPLLGPDTDESRLEFARYWGLRITAWNPDQLRPPDLQHPSSLAPADVANTANQFTAFINRFQVHSTCSYPYCFRRQDSNICRFFFPRPLFREPVVT
jgi:hypothetical protein